TPEYSLASTSSLFPVHTYPSPSSLSFFSKHPAPTALYTLSLHDALPIFSPSVMGRRGVPGGARTTFPWSRATLKLNSPPYSMIRSEEHTSELQSRRDLVCRLLLEKKKKNARGN